MTSYLPSTTAQISDAAMMAAGALLGWLRHPLIWVVAGPFRFLALLLAAASQESTYNAANTSGDNGASWGILQFNEGTWPNLTGRSNDDRTSAFLSGYYAAAYVAEALSTSWAWYTVALPIFGFAQLRWMWTHGTSDDDASTGLSGAWGAMMDEARAWPSFLLWRAISLPAMVAGGFALLALLGRAGARRWRRGRK